MKNPLNDKLTSRLKNVLSTASRISKDMKHREIGTEHILYGMMQETGSLAGSILKKFGFTPEFIRTELERMEKSDKWKEELSEHSRAVFEKAARTAFQHRHRYIGTEHVLHTMLNMKEAKAYKLLEKSPADIKSLAQQVQIVLKSTSHFPDLSNFLGVPLGISPGAKKHRPGQVILQGGPQPGQQKKSKTPAFDYFTQDLTAAAAAGKFDPVVGRDKEVERVMSILNRKSKNNPILIGEPGTGKTAIVNSLAQRISAGNVPDKLQRRRILSLDMASILAGTTFRGEFEERVKELMKELETNRDVILFIDELHTIVGAGAAGGSLDAANMLKPVLARGEISIIGATTLDEFRKHIEKDAALERRFQPVQVKEPSPEETVAMLEGNREAYEQHHGLEVTDAAINSAVEMSVRYIPDRFLPDKAFDLLDEAAANLQLQFADGSDAKETSAIKKELEKLHKIKEQAIEAENYEEALLAKRKEQELGSKLASISRQLTTKRSKQPAITEEHIAKVVADSTGIPVTRLLKSELKKLTNLEELLRKNIVGQDQAITAVARYVRRSRAGIAHPNRPLGSFMFLGPTGVGKTETAKVLAREVFEDEDALIRVDMSEFMEAHSVSRLIGAPAGYVGYEDGGKLTEQVRRRPYSIILFDEIEKAHRDIFNILLQILDEGQLTDSHGRTVNFRNTIIIITSNIGSHELAQQAQMGFGLPEESTDQVALQDRYEELKESVLKALKEKMPPELLGRLDQTIVYSPLSLAALEVITDLQIHELQKRLTAKNLQLNVSKGVKSDIAKRAFEVGRGARPIRGIVQEMLEDPIANSLISEEISGSAKVQARKTGGRVQVTTQSA